MLPFLLGIVWLLQEIGAYLGTKQSAKYLILLVLVDPFFAGQSILISPDIVLGFCFFDVHLWYFVSPDILFSYWEYFDGID